MPSEQEESAHYHNAYDLEDGRPALDPGAAAGPSHVDGGDEGDHAHGGHPGCEGAERHELPEIGRRSDCQGGYGAAADDEEEGPAEEKGGERAERVADVDVEPSRIRAPGAQLGIGQRAEKGEDPADQPDQEGQADRPLHLTQHCAGHDENSGADDRADHDVDQLRETENAPERRGCRWFGHRARPRRSVRTVSRSMRSRSTVTPIPGRSIGTAISPSPLMVHSGVTMS